MSDQGPVPAASYKVLIILTHPRCRQEMEVGFILGTFMELLDVEVVGRQK